MEQRLESIENLLQVLASGTKTPSGGIQSGSGPPPGTITPMPSTSVSLRNLQVEQFEGESSLLAHSRQAHQALQHLLETAPMTIRNDPNTVNALASLRNLLEKYRSEPPSISLLSQARTPNELQHSELPPREEVLRLFAYVEGTDDKLLRVLFDTEDYDSG